jgi:hypothetical protein
VNECQARLRAKDSGSKALNCVPLITEINELKLNNNQALILKKKGKTGRQRIGGKLIF